MWKIIVENYQIILSTAAIILQLIGALMLFFVRRRVKAVARTDKELVNDLEQEKEKAEKASSIAVCLMSIPHFIKEAEEVFTAPKSGSLKLGYVIQQVQKRFNDAHIKANATELTDYIESILATPEKKGEIDVSKAHETSQR